MMRPSLEQNQNFAGFSAERRGTRRISTHFPIKCRIIPENITHYSKRFLNGEWECVNISSQGLKLQAQVHQHREIFVRLHYFFKSLLAMIKFERYLIHPGPPIPPDNLKVSIKISVPNTGNEFILKGNLVWFKWLWQEIYTMGVRFDPQSQVIIHDDGGRNICITAYFPKENLPIEIIT